MLTLCAARLRSYTSEIKKHGPTFKQCLLIALVSVLLYLSMDIDTHRQQNQHFQISPLAQSHGTVKILVWSDSLGEIKLPPQGWTKTTDKYGQVQIVAHRNASPLEVGTGTDGAIVNIEKGPTAGIINVLGVGGQQTTYNLKSNQPGILTLYLGGNHAGALTNPHPVYPAGTHLLLLTLLVFALSAATVLSNKIAAGTVPHTPTPTWRTILALASFPLLASIVTFVSFFPANAAFDSGYQWSEAAVPQAVLNEAIGPFTTLFMRAFTLVSHSPAPLIVLQLSCAAIGAALVLAEMIRRGASCRVALLAALLVAITPQYGLFFTYLSKDALCGVALLYCVWTILWVSRTAPLKTTRWSACFLVALTGFLTGAFRVNLLPAVAWGIFCLALYLLAKRVHAKALFMVVSFIVLLAIIPNLLVHFSAESLSQRTARTTTPAQLTLNDLPMGLLWGYHIFHLFAASVDSGLPIAAGDSALFYQLAPATAWKQYRCFMTDTTTEAVFKKDPFPKQERLAFLIQNQREMTRALLRIIAQHPSILLARQSCTTRILWSIGYHQLPFLAPLTIGYDSVPESFLKLAGPNHSLFSETLRQKLVEYQGYTQNQQHFWLFWKPALPLLIIGFLLLLGLMRRADSGVIITATILVSGLAVLALVIPFPAYRYVYPFILVGCLLSVYGFAKPLHPKA